MRSLVYKFISIFLLLGSLCSLSSCQDREIVTTVSVNQLVTSKEGNSYKITGIEINDNYLIIKGDFDLTNYKFSSLILSYYEKFRVEQSIKGELALNYSQTTLINEGLNLKDPLTCNREIKFAFDKGSLENRSYNFEIDFGIAEINYDKTIFKIFIDFARTE